MAWMFWLWEKWGESKIWNRGRGGKRALTDPVVLKTLFGSDVACDYLSLNQLLWTCINHWFNGSNPTWWEFKERLRNTLSDPSIVGFSLQLQQLRTKLFHEALQRRRITCCAPHMIWEKFDFLAFCFFFWKKAVFSLWFVHCKGSSKRGHFNGNFGWLVVQLPINIHQQ